MPRLTALEKAELLTLPVVITLGWIAPLPPGFTVRIGTLVTGASLLLLLQGFCRDVWLGVAARRATTPSEPHYARCMCVESALGFTGVVAAAGLTAFRFGPPIPVSPAGLTWGLALVLVLGFALKDFVFEWSPWKIYRAKNHATLHFRWKA